MKIRLLNTGGFRSLKNVKLPVEVEGESVYGGDAYSVDFNVIASLPGFKYWDKDTEYGTQYTFFTGSECEVVE